jgi:general secretion pathway protein G
MKVAPKIRTLRSFRRAFTLVELLITIIITGILASAMLLVMGSGSDKAEATKIVSNLRALKGAALMYYVDKTDVAKTLTEGDISLLEKFMDRSLNNDKVDYEFKIVKEDDSTHWYVGMIKKDSYPTARVSLKLAEMAESVGLYGSAASDDFYKQGDESIYMRAR